MAKTAAELMAELANDKQHQAKKAENERKTDELKNICERDEKDLVRDINNNGFSIKSVWDFVNSQNDYFDAIPVLINHLKIEHHPKILAGIARSLAVPQLADNDELWLILVGHYRSISSDKQIEKPENRGAQEAIAVAIEALANSSRVDELEKLIKFQPDGDGVDWLKDKIKALRGK